MFGRVFPTRRQADTPAVRLSGRLTQVMAQHAATVAQQTPAAPSRRVPFGAVAAVLILLLGIGCVVVALRTLSQPATSTPTPAAVVTVAPAPVEPVVAPAPVLMPPVVYVFPTPTPAPYQPRHSVRGGPLPEPQPGVVRVPIMGSWKMYYPPREETP